MKPSPHTSHNNQLRAWIKKKRAESGLSQRAVAHTIDRHHSVVGKMEQDRRKIEIVEFVQYCQALGADPHEGLELLIKSLKKGSRL